jgi:biopolymer transport protein ExbD
MKPTLLRLISLVLSISLGLAIFFLFKNHDVSDELIPPVENSSAVLCANEAHVNYVVISVPADGEFYIGKRRVELSQISAVIARSLRSIPCNDRVVYIKSAAEVRFETLDLVLHAAKEAGINRIEFVLDKKKAGTKNS